MDFYSAYPVFTVAQSVEQYERNKPVHRGKDYYQSNMQLTVE